MRNQKEINERMRAILVDWLIEVHLKFKLREDTLFLTINLMDRYLEKREVAKGELQLVGATAMFVACKFEEIHPPELQDFVYVTDKAYTNSDFIRMEEMMLKTLNYAVIVVTPNTLLRRLHQLDQKCNKMTYFLSSYFIELALIEYRMIKYRPSLQAAAALYLARKTCKLVPAWDEFFEKYTTYSEDSIRPCAKDICALLHGIEKSRLQAVKTKYSSTERMEVAKVKF